MQLFFYLIFSDENKKNGTCPICFEGRYTLDPKQSDDFMVDGQTEEQKEHMDKWYEIYDPKNVSEAGDKMVLNGTAMCGHTLVQYFFLFWLPDGWEQGAEVNVRQKQIILERLAFNHHLPYSCEVSDFERIRTKFCIY